MANKAINDLLKYGARLVTVGLPQYANATEASAGIDGVKMTAETDYFKIVGRANSEALSVSDGAPGIGSTGANRTLVFDLGKARRLTSFNYSGPSSSSGVYGIRLNKLEVSVNGSTWVTLWNTYSGLVEQNVTDTTQYRYIRAYLVKASGASGTSYAGAFNVNYQKLV